MERNVHDNAAELMTWKVNGRLTGEDAAWLDAHLVECAACRAELAGQQRLRAALTRDPTVEFAPQPSFNLLWQQIEAERDGAVVAPRADSRAAPATAPATAAGAAPRVRGGRRASGELLRAAVFAQAAAILVLGWVAWQGHARAPAADYRTVTDAGAPVPVQPFIKAVFDDAVRLGDVKEILTTAGLAIAAGPTEAGVYTLTAVDTATRDRALQGLRADPRVRFAEAGGT